MNRFKFRLEKVLNLTLSREKQAEAELAEARRREEDEKRRLLEIEKNIIKVLAGARELERRPASVTEIKKYRDFLKKLNGDRELQRQAVERAAEVTARKLAALLEVRKKRKTLENLRDRREADYRRQSLAEEQKVLDEVGGQAAGRRRTSA
ncbi:MAG TPA: flagellar export protein FliJ [Bacillota bacterium]